jgi:hypothetical protein
MCIIYYPAASNALQPSQPLPGIINLSKAWVNVFPIGTPIGTPEVKEFP